MHLNGIKCIFVNLMHIHISMWRERKKDGERGGTELLLLITLLFCIIDHCPKTIALSIDKCMG